MASIAYTLKSAVKGILDDLERAGTLGSVMVNDLRKASIALDTAKYPVAVISHPSVESDYADNGTNLRVHTFEVLVIQKGENVRSDDQVEELMEAVLNAFDNDETLGGAAMGGMRPAASTPESTVTPDGTFIMFSITLKAHALYTKP